MIYSENRAETDFIDFRNVANKELIRDATFCHRARRRKLNHDEILKVGNYLKMKKI